MLCLYYHKLQTLQTACLSFKTSGSQATCTPWVQSQTEKMVSSVILFAVRYSVQDVLRIESILCDLPRNRPDDRTVLPLFGSLSHRPDLSSPVYSNLVGFKSTQCLGTRTDKRLARLARDGVNIEPCAYTNNE